MEIFVNILSFFFYKPTILIPCKGETLHKPQLLQKLQEQSYMCMCTCENESNLKTM